DYSENLRASDGSVSSVSIFFYGTNRASAAGVDDAMTMSENRRGSLTGTLRSRTYYVGEKGDEIADYSENLRASDGSVSSVSIFFYGTNRASAAGVDDAMTMSENRRNAIGGVLLSKTYYVGEKGDEIADYTETYKSNGTIISTISIFFYGSGQTRASVAGVDDALVRSDAHKTNSVASASIANRRYTTFYDTRFGKGEEIADYTYQYLVQDGTTVKFTIAYEYAGRRASSADADDALTKDTIYRLTTTTKAYERYYTGEKGDEEVTRSDNYYRDGSGVFSTTTYTYGGAGGALSQQVTQAGGKTIFTADYFGEKGDEKISRTQDRKGVVNNYSYSGENLDTVTVEGSGTFIKYRQNAFGEDEVDYVEDYRTIRTYYTYNNGVLASTSQSYSVTGGTKTITTTYELDQWLEERVASETASGAGKVGTTTYHYNADFSLAYTVSTIGGNSITYYKKNEYNESVVDFANENGLMVKYNTEELGGPGGDRLSFRTIMTRTQMTGDLSSFDSITIFDKYGERYAVIDRDGVTQYNYYIGNRYEQRSVVGSVYHYDLDGLLLDMTQDELVGEEHTDSEGDSYTTWRVETVTYNFSYTFDGSGNVSSATATGEGGRLQKYDQYMRILENYDSQGGKQIYTYFADPPDIGSTSSVKNSLRALSMIGSFRGRIDALNYDLNDLANNTITVNGIVHKVDPAETVIVSESGMALSWEALRDMYQNNELHYVRVTRPSFTEGTNADLAERIELVSDIGNISNATFDISNNTITVNGTTYTVDPATVEITDDSEMHINWSGATDSLEAIYNERAPVGDLTNVWITSPDGAQVTKIGLSFGYMKVGTEELMFNSATKVFDADGQPISIQELADRVNNENNPYVHTKVSATKITKEVWRADTIEIIKAPVQQVTGQLDNLYNPAGLSIMDGIISSTGTDTIEFAGGNIKVLDTTLVVDGTGNTVFGTAAEMVSQLEDIRQIYQDEGTGLTVKLIAMRDGDQWIAQKITVTHSSLPYVEPSVFTGTVTTINTTDWTLTFDDETMDLDEISILNPNGVFISRDQLYQLWDGSPEKKVFARVETQREEGKWHIRKMIVVSQLTGDGMVNGVLDGITTIDATTGTIQIDDKTIEVNAESIIKDSDNNIITLGQLANILSFDTMSFVNTNVDAVFNVVGDKLVLTELHVLTGLRVYYNVTSEITSIDTTTRTMALAQGISFKVKDSIDLTEFTQGDFVRVRVLSTIDGWEGQSITEAAEPTDSISGAIRQISTTAGTIKIGNVEIKYVEGQTIVEDRLGDEVTGGIQGLAASFAVPNSQVLVSAEVEKVAGVWYAKKIKVTNVVGDAFSLSSSDVTVLSYDEIGNPTKLLIDGITVDIGNNVEDDGFFTGVKLQYYNYFSPVPHSSVGLRSQNANPDYDLVDLDDFQARYDLDNDGMADSMEIDIWGSTTTTNYPFEHDSDSDGMQDIIEALYAGGGHKGATLSFQNNWDIPGSNRYQWLGDALGYTLYNDKTDADEDGVYDSYEAAVYGNLDINMQGDISYDSNSNGVADVVEMFLFKSLSRNENKNYEIIGGLKGFLSKTANSVGRSDVMPAMVTVDIIKTGNTWRAKNIMGQTVSPSGSGEADGLIQDVNVENNTITLNGVTIAVDGETAIKDQYGGFYTLAQLKELYEANNLGGLDTHVTDGDIHRGYTIQTGAIDDGERSTITKDVTLYYGSTVMFDWKVSSEQDKDLFKFEVWKDGELFDTSTTPISGEADWQTVTKNLGAGKYTLKWIYEKDASGIAGYDAGWLDNVKIKPMENMGTFTDSFDYPIGTVLELPTGYTTDAAHPWVNQNITVYGGSGFAAQAGAVYNGDQSSMQKAFDLTTAVSDAALNFRWKTASGNKILKLEVYNGLNQLVAAESIGGGTYWQSITPLLLTKGDIYTVKWIYTNNDPIGDNNKTAWIDDVGLAFAGMQSFEYPAGTAIPLPAEYMTDSWVNQNTDTFENIGFTAEAGAVYNGGQSIMEREIDLITSTTDATLNFEWKTSYPNLPQGYTTDSWINQNKVIYGSGEGFAAQAGVVYDGDEAYMQRTLDLTGQTKNSVLNFFWKTGAGDKQLKVQIYDDLNNIVAEQSIGGDIDWTRCNDVILAGGNRYTVKWTYKNSGATNALEDSTKTAWVDNVTVTLEEYADEFDYPPNTIRALPAEFTTDAANPWVNQNIIAFDDKGFSAKAGAVYGGAQTYIQKVIDLTSAQADGLFSFDWKVSEGDKTLKLEIYNSLNQLVAQRSITNGTDWQASQEIELLKGDSYTVKWIYANNDETGDDSQTAWVDNIYTRANYHALKLDGVDDYLNLPTLEKDIENTSAGTVAAWIKRDREDVNTEVIFMHADLNDTKSYIALEIDYSDKLVLRYVKESDTYSKENNVTIMGSTVLNKDTWYHVALTSDGSEYKLYVNGREETLTDSIGRSLEKAGIPNTGNWFDTLEPGNYSDFVGKFDLYAYTSQNHMNFKGMVDGLGVYDRALTGSNLQSLMGSGLQGNENGLLLYQTYDDGTVIDITDNENNGSLRNHTDEVLDASYFTPPALPLGADYTTDGNWSVQNSVSYDTNGSAVKAAAVYDDNQTYMQRTVDLRGQALDSNLSFFWKTAAGNKELKVEVYNGLNELVNTQTISGGTDWKQCNDITLGAGDIYTIKWTYKNDNLSTMTKDDLADALYDAYSAHTQSLYNKLTTALRNSTVTSASTAAQMKTALLTLAAGDTEFTALINSIDITDMTNSQFSSALYNAYYERRSSLYDTLTAALADPTVTGAATSVEMKAALLVLATGDDVFTAIINSANTDLRDDTQTAWIDNISVDVKDYVEKFDSAAIGKELKVEVYDSLNNLVAQQSIFGGTDWSAAAPITLTKGEAYTVKWIYVNQAPENADTETAWVDDIAITVVPETQKFEEPKGTTKAIPAGYTTDSWTNQNAVSYKNTGYALQAGAAYNGNTSYIQQEIDLTTAPTDGRLSFLWKASDGAGKQLKVEVYDSLNNLLYAYQPYIAGGTNWKNYYVYLDKGDRYLVKWIYTNTEATGDDTQTAWIDNITLDPYSQDQDFYYAPAGTTLNLSNAFATDSWFADNDEGWGFEAQAGAVYGGNETYMQTTIDLVTPVSDGILSFYWDLSYGNKELRVEVYNSQNELVFQDAITPESGWSSPDITLTQGDTYTVKWIYKNNDTGLAKDQFTQALISAAPEEPLHGRLMTVLGDPTVTDVTTAAEAKAALLLLAAGDAELTSLINSIDITIGDDTQTAWVSSVWVDYWSEYDYINIIDETSFALPEGLTTGTSDSWALTNTRSLIEWDDCDYFEAQAAAVYNGNESYMQKQFDLTSAVTDGNLSFSWEVSAGDKELRIEVYDSLNNLVAQQSVSGTAERDRDRWYSTPIKLAKGDAYTVKWIYKNNATMGDDAQTAWVDYLSLDFAPIVELFDYPAGTVLPFPAEYTSDSWINQNTMATSAAGFAAQARAVYSGTSTYMQRTVDLTTAATNADISFKWKTSDGNKHLRVEVYDSLNNLIVQKGIGGGVDWETIPSITLTKGQIYTVKWVYINDDATGDDSQTAWVDDVTIQPAVELQQFEYPEGTVLALPAGYTTDSWVEQNTLVYGETGFAAQSGAVYSGASTYMQTQVDLTTSETDGRFSFIWKASDGAGKTLKAEIYNGLNNLIAQTSINGGTDWQAVTPITLAKGQIYTIKWIYANTGTTGDDTQTAWVDNILIETIPAVQQFEYPKGTILEFPLEYATDGWTKQNTTAYSGLGFALQAAAVYNGSSNYVQRSIDLTEAATDGTLSYVWKVAEGDGKELKIEVYDSLNNLVTQETILGGTDWKQNRPITLKRGDTYTIKWIYKNTDLTGDDTQTAWLDEIELTVDGYDNTLDYPVGTIFELDKKYTTDTDTPWIRQNTIAYGGLGFAVQAGTVYNSASTYMQRQIDLTASTTDGTLSFLWKTSEGDKQLKVEVYDSSNNLVAQETIGGGVVWQANTPIRLTKGDIYTIKWTYINNDATGDDAQTAWIDNINVTLDTATEPFDYPEGSVISLPSEYVTDSWVDQNSVAYGGIGFAAQAGAVYDGTTSYMQREVDLTNAATDGKLSFIWKTSEGTGKILKLEIYDDLNNLIAQTYIGNGIDWQAIAPITLAKGKDYTIKWIYSNTGATGDDTQTAWVDNINIALNAETEQFDYATGTELALPSGYATDSWIDQNTVAYGGIGFAAQAGAAYNGATTYMQKVVDLTAAQTDGKLSFFWKAADGSGKAMTVEVYDSLNNMVAQTSIAGGTDWQAIAPITLAKGQAYTVKWVYTDTEATGDNTQTGWVDNINISLNTEIEPFDYPADTELALPDEYTTDSWVDQNALAYGDVGFAAKAGAVYNGATTYMQRTVDLTTAETDGKLNFIWKASDGSGKALTVEVYDSLNNMVAQTSIAGGTDWQAIAPIILVKGQTYNIKWIYTNTEATGDDTQTAWIDNVNIALDSETEPFDYPAGTTLTLPSEYTTDTWVDQNMVAYGGVGFAAKAGAVYNGATTYMQRQVNLTYAQTDGMFNFAWKASDGTGKALTVEVYDSL
ncbi:MAG: LamG domain-containing protein, partial [Candidatus Omnitrophota bacterium]